MITFDKASYRYGSNTVTDNVSFHIKSGDFAAVAGANGAGKTTISKLASGLLKPITGTVTINGADTKTTKASTIAQSVGFLFQNPDRQICQNTVRDEISFSLRTLKKSADEITERTNELLQQFGFDPDAAPFNLSRGERQRLALASALAARPKILILDEPTTGLDYKECMSIMNLIKAENESGTTVFMVCHDMEIISDFATRLLVIDSGRLIADAPPEDIFFNADVCARASLLPPQIIELSQRLGGDFDRISRIDGMYDLIFKKCGTEVHI